jgi:hypothetical protein
VNLQIPKTSFFSHLSAEFIPENDYPDQQIQRKKTSIYCLQDVSIGILLGFFLGTMTSGIDVSLPAEAKPF